MRPLIDKILATLKRCIKSNEVGTLTTAERETKMADTLEDIAWHYRELGDTVL